MCNLLRGPADLVADNRIYSIVQRAGVVPMSIAGIAKEVTTITISAWFFGDELTPLNITGVAITICGMQRSLPRCCYPRCWNISDCGCAIIGIALFTYHKYRKSIESTVPLDAHGNPIEVDDDVGGDDIGNYVELDQIDHRNISLLGATSEAVSESVVIVIVPRTLMNKTFLGHRIDIR